MLLVEQYKRAGTQNDKAYHNFVLVCIADGVSEVGNEVVFDSIVQKASEVASF